MDIDLLPYNQLPLQRLTGYGFDVEQDSFGAQDRFARTGLGPDKRNRRRNLHRRMDELEGEMSNQPVNAEPLKTMRGVFDNFYRKTEEPTVPEAGKAEKEGTEE